MKLIAFCGPAGSGKSTAAQCLIALGYAKVSFADPLRRMLAVLTDIDRDYNERKNEPRWELGGKTVRQAMQTLGTEWGRGTLSDDIWIRQFERRVTQNPTANWVVDDCRFDNEAKVVRELGGVVVEVRRPGFDFSREHASEAGISPELVDMVVSGSTPKELWGSMATRGLLPKQPNP